MAFDVKQFIDNHADILSAEEQQELQRGYLRDSDYQRNMNRLKAEHAARMAEEDRYRESLATWQQQQQQLLEQSTSTIQQQQVPAQGLSLAEVQQMLAAERQSILQQVGPAVAGVFHLSKRMPKYIRDYERDFGREFDADEFQRFCEANNIQDSDLGYTLYTAADRTKALEEKHVADLKAAREEGERSALSRHHIPDGYNAGRALRASPLMRQPTGAPYGTVAASSAPPPPVSMPVVAAPATATNIANAVAGDPNIAAKMQANFQAALDK